MVVGSSVMNLALAHEALATAYPDRDCVVTPTRRVTYGQMLDRVRRFANLLHAHGLGCQRERSQLANHESGQDHLGIYMLNCPEYLEAMIGSFRARVAPFNVNYRYVEDELLYLLTDSDATALVYQARYAPMLAAIRDRLPKLKLLIQLADESGTALLPGAIDYETALAAAPATHPPVTPSSDDLYILYTGGTTGMPKGVLWRQENIFHAAMAGGVPGENGPETYAALVERAQHGGFMRTMATPPLMHGAAQWVSFGTLHMGGTVLLQGKPEKLDADDVWGLIEREGASTMTIVGDAFARPLLDGLKQRPYDVSRLFVIGSGGAILSPHYKQAILEAIPHATVVDGFGASETGAQGSRATRGGDEAQTGSFNMQNTIVLDYDLKNQLAPGAPETGWLARVGHVPLGYYKDPEKTAKTFPVVGGVRYAVPGDHAQLAEDGQIVVLGRGSVCINSGGEKIYPEEVEQILRKHPKVYDAVVVGTPDERFGEQVNAVVQLKPGETLEHQEIVDFAAQQLSRYKLPKHTVIVSQMERSPSGKPDYRWAKAQAINARTLSS
jgi:3-oxocholest-4-en-26-oate---CoA ligase